MTDLTTAAGFEVESGDADTVNRWTKKGDRLYVNDLAGNYDGGYVDFETGEVTDAGENVTGEITVDGDTLTIEYVAKEYGISYTNTHEYTVVIAIDWGETEIDCDDEESETEERMDEMVSAMKSNLVDDADEETDDGEDDETVVDDESSDEDDKGVDRGSCVVTDGGEDVSQQFSDDDIATAIDDNAAEASVAEVRDVLTMVQVSFEQVWSSHMDAVEDNTMELVGMDGDVLVFADHSGQFWNAEFDNGPLAERDIGAGVKQAVIQLHHQWARRHSDYDWGVDYPVVIRQPDSFDAGQQLVEAVMLNLTSRGATPRQAWAVWGVLAGNSRNNWASRMGYDSHSGVSNAVRDAQEKIPLPYV